MLGNVAKDALGGNKPKTPLKWGPPVTFITFLSKSMILSKFLTFLNFPKPTRGPRPTRPPGDLQYCRGWLKMSQYIPERSHGKNHARKRAQKGPPVALI